MREGRVRLGAIALAAAGILFVLFPATRPFSDESSLQGAAAFASGAWVLSHVLGMIAFTLLVLGLLALHLRLRQSAAERLALLAMVIAWLGVGLILPYYGAEAFALQVIGREALGRQDAGLFALAEEVRLGAGLPLFGAGLILLAAGAVLAAVAVWRSRILPKWSGVPLALGFALYIPQYYWSQPLRIAHGALVAAGCLWVAAAMVRYRGD